MIMKKENNPPTLVRMLELPILSYWHWAGIELKKYGLKGCWCLRCCIHEKKLEDSSFGLLGSFYFLFINCYNHCEWFFWWFFDIKNLILIYAKDLYEMNVRFHETEIGIGNWPQARISPRTSTKTHFIQVFSSSVF